MTRSPASLAIFVSSVMAPPPVRARPERRSPSSTAKSTKRALGVSSLPSGSRGPPSVLGFREEAAVDPDERLFLIPRELGVEPDRGLDVRAGGRVLVQEADPGEAGVGRDVQGVG